MAGSFSQTLSVTTIYLTAFLSNVKEYHSIEISDQMDDMYVGMREIVAANHGPFRLEYQHVDALVGGMMDFVRDHAVSMIKQDAAIFCDEDDPFRTARELHFMASIRRPDVESFRIMHEYMLMDMYEIFVDELFKGLKNHDRGFAEFVRLLRAVLYPRHSPNRYRMPKSANDARSPKYVTLRRGTLLPSTKNRACAAADDRSDP
jgi:hypothetical protein